jgi:hypothetical protein
MLQVAGACGACSGDVIPHRTTEAASPAVPHACQPAAASQRRMPATFPDSQWGRATRYVPLCTFMYLHVPSCAFMLKSMHVRSLNVWMSS